MRGNEPVDLMKSAIAVMLVCLLLGATLSFFYMLFDNTDSRIHSMEKATSSSSTERLAALQDKTFEKTGDISNLPLVANIVNVLQEYSEDDLLFVQIHDPMYFTTDIYTYTGTTLVGVENPDSIHASDIPVTEAVRHLLGYSNCRAELILGRWDVSTGALLNATGNEGLLYVQINIQRDPLASGGV